MSAPNATPMPQPDCDVRSKLLWTVLLLAGLGFLTVSGCLTAPLLQLDDRLYILHNPFLRPDCSWLDVMTGSFYNQYAPVMNLSYRINAALFGLEAAWSYRLVNCILHIASACLMTGLLRTLGVGRMGALFISCVWVVHPMACESVAWIAERNNVLAFFFGLLSLRCYVLCRSTLTAVLLSSLFLGLALLSKPFALAWTPVFVALELLGGQTRLSGAPDDHPSERRRRAVVRLTPILLIAAGLTALGLSGYCEVYRVPPGGTWFNALLTDMGLFARYVLNTLAPFWLSAFYGTDEIRSILDPRCAAWLVFWCVLIGGTVRLSISWRRSLFGWFWFFGALGPCSNIVSIGYSMQDRFVYLASVGLLLVFVETAAGIRQRVAAWRQQFASRTWIGPALAAAYIAMLCGLTIERSAVWRSDLTLLEQAVTMEPEAAVAHAFYAGELVRSGFESQQNAPEKSRKLFEKASEHYRLALNLPDTCLFFPPSTKVHWGNCLYELGEHDAAITLLGGLLSPLPSTARRLKLNLRSFYEIDCERCGHHHQIPFEDVARGHRTLAQIHLLRFLTAEDRRALEELRQAAVQVDLALGHDAYLVEACYMAGCIFVTVESASTVSADTVSSARTVCRLANAGLARLSEQMEVRAALCPPFPPERIKALGCLGMAQASLDLAFSTPQSPDIDHLNRLTRWAQRALEFDPDFGEAFWLQAQAKGILAKVTDEKGKKEEALDLLEQARGLLSRIKPGSPRHKQAQDLLVQLSQR